MNVRNMAASVGQVVCSALIMFLLYRTILQILGPERLGIWSVVLATVSTSRIGELGIGASVTRFVAMYQARGEHNGAGDALQTATISVGVLFGIAMIPVYLLLVLVFKQIFPHDALTEAFDLLPYAMVSLLLTAVGGVFQSGLDGCQRYDRRAMLVLTGQVLFLIGAIVMTPRFGLVGLAWAQIGQGVLLLIAGWISLCKTMKDLPWFPRRWRKASFREMLGYSIQVQLGSIAMMLFEPFTKALLGKFGGLAAAGYFEMASQFIGKVRSLVVSANQIVVPVAAGFNECAPGKLLEIYRINLRLLIFLTVPLYSVVVAWAPLLSSIWLGRYEQQFVFFVALLTIAWGVNTLNVPAYFINSGTGRVLWNTTAHVLIGLTNVVFGLILGPCFGATGVAIGTALSLVFGSVWVVYGFHKEQHISWRLLLPRESYMLVVTGFVTGSLGYVCYYAMTGYSTWTRSLVCLVIPPILFLPVLWLHPLRLVIQKRLFDDQKSEAARSR